MIKDAYTPRRNSRKTECLRQRNSNGGGGLKITPQLLFAFSVPPDHTRLQSVTHIRNATDANVRSYTYCIGRGPYLHPYRFYSTLFEAPCN